MYKLEVKEGVRIHGWSIIHHLFVLHNSIGGEEVS